MANNNRSLVYRADEDPPIDPATLPAVVVPPRGLPKQPPAPTAAPTSLLARASQAIQQGAADGAMSTTGQTPQSMIRQTDNAQLPMAAQMYVPQPPASDTGPPPAPGIPQPAPADTGPPIAPPTAAVAPGNGINFGLDRPGMQRFALEAAARQASEGRPEDNPDLRRSDSYTSLARRGANGSDVPDQVSAEMQFELAKARPDVGRLEALARTQAALKSAAAGVDTQNANNRGIGESATAANSRSLAGKAAAEAQGMAQLAPGALATQAANIGETKAKTGSLTEQANLTNVQAQAGAQDIASKKRLFDLGTKLGAETDPAKQTLLSNQILTLMGKDPKNFQAIHAAGGADPSDPLGQRKLSDNIVIFDNNTGKASIVPLGQNAAPAGAPPEGTRGMFNGKPGVIKGGKFVPD